MGGCQFCKVAVQIYKFKTIFKKWRSESFLHRSVLKGNRIGNSDCLYSLYWFDHFFLHILVQKLIIFQFVNLELIQINNEVFHTIVDPNFSC